MQINSINHTSSSFAGRNTTLVFNRDNYNFRKVKVSEIKKIDEYFDRGKMCGLLEIKDFTGIHKYHTGIPMERVLGAYMTACIAPNSLDYVELHKDGYQNLT